MECSICFDQLSKNNFIGFLKNKNIDICNNDFKCIEKICTKCMIEYIKNEDVTYNKKCPLCRDHKFEYLITFYEFYKKLLNIHKKINNLKQDIDIMQRMYKIYYYFNETFDESVKMFNNDKLDNIEYYLYDLKSDMKNLENIIKDFN